MGLGLAVFLAAAFTRGIVLYPAALPINGFSFGGKYGVGEVIHGITWDNAMSDLRVDINNPTNRDYDRLDLTRVDPKLSQLIRSVGPRLGIQN
jgi:hypothetical protein